MPEKFSRRGLLHLITAPVVLGLTSCVTPELNNPAPGIEQKKSYNFPDLPLGGDSSEEIAKRRAERLVREGFGKESSLEDITTITAVLSGWYLDENNILKVKYYFKDPKDSHELNIKPEEGIYFKSKISNEFSGFKTNDPEQAVAAMGNFLWKDGPVEIVINKTEKVKYTFLSTKGRGR